MLEIQYTVNKCSAVDLQSHLYKCSSNFTPALEDKVSIPEYAQKIKRLAVTFEAWHSYDLVGLIAVYFNDAQRQTAFVTNVSIVSEYQGKRIATILLSDCIRYANVQRFTNLVLRLSVKNQTAFHLYTKLGFDEVSRDCDEIEMRKIIHLTN